MRCKSYKSNEIKSCSIGSNKYSFKYLALQHPAFLNCLSVVDKAAMGNNTVGKSVVDGVDRGSSNVATGRGRGVDWLAGVGDLSNVASQVVGVVGDGLDPAVGEVDGVRSSHGTSAIVGLGLLEVGLGVVVGHIVGVGVGGGLSEVGGSNSVHHRGVLGGGRGGSHKGKGDEGLHV